MYKFIQSSVKINSNGGFSFIHCMFNANGGMKLRDSALGARHNANYPTSRIVRSMIVMMTAGECDYARIDDYNKDCLFRNMAGGDLPLPECLRQRLDSLFGDWQSLKRGNCVLDT